jgi:hypothetical protein
MAGMDGEDGEDGQEQDHRHGPVDEVERLLHPRHPARSFTSMILPSTMPRMIGTIGSDEPLQDVADDAEHGGDDAVGRGIAQRIDADEGKRQDADAEEPVGDLHDLDQRFRGDQQEDDHQHVEDQSASRAP